MEKMKKIWRTVIDVIFVLSAVTTVIATIVYLFSRKVIPGLAPFTLAIVLLIIAFNIHSGRFSKRKAESEDNEENDDSDFLRIILLVAFILNVFVGFMQIHAYLIR